MQNATESPSHAPLARIAPSSASTPPLSFFLSLSLSLSLHHPYSFTMEPDEKAALQPSPPSPSSPNEHAPPLGTRIQVLWRIHYADASAPLERWWGAVVQDRTQATVGTISPQHSTHNLYILLYDAYAEFPEDVSKVAFVSADTLLDVSQAGDENKGILDWQLETDKPDEDSPMSLGEYAQLTDVELEQVGLSQNADLDVLATMPAHVQTHVVSGYRLFADGVKESLQKLRESKPKGYVVTAEDVQQMCASLNQK